MVYKRGISNDPSMVKSIQSYLGLTPDGIFGKNTERAVIEFQYEHNLIADGIVGPKTLEMMGILDTDLMGSNVIKAGDIVINKNYLPDGEYIREEVDIDNNYIVLHHTAGWNNPYSVVQQWGSDTRGKIATEFVIGGLNAKNGDDKYDGVIVKSFPDGCQGWHIGNSGSSYMNKHSVGIEMCNFGYLDSNMKTYTGTQCSPDQICELSEPFRGFKMWHKYSDKQLYSLKRLIEYVGVRDNIDIRNGLVKWINKEGVKAFDYHQEAYDGKVRGLITHANIRKDKFDVFPQLELIDMLLML